MPSNYSESSDSKDAPASRRAKPNQHSSAHLKERPSQQKNHKPERTASRAQLQEQIAQLQEQFDELDEDHEMLKEEVNVLRVDIRNLYKKWHKDHEKLRQPSASERLAHEVLELRKDLKHMHPATPAESIEETYQSEYRREARQMAQAKRESEPAPSKPASPRAQWPSKQTNYGLRQCPWRGATEEPWRPSTARKRKRERSQERTPIPRR